MATATAGRRSRAASDDVSPKLRDRLLPRSVLGVTALLLAMAIGAAFSGTVLYAYYEYRLTTYTEQDQNFAATFSENFDNAIGTIKAEREDAKKAVQEELQPLKELQAGGGALQRLLDGAKPSTWFVRTLDEAGQPSVGSAFVIASDSEQTLLLTNYSVVSAATRKPGPEVFIRRGDDERKVTLWTWQEDQDLALLILGDGDQPKIPVASDPDLELGERLFAVSGLGSSGGAIVQGSVADVFSAGIQHDAAIGSSFRGGPLLNNKGEVVGIASRSYAPLGFPSEGVYFGIPIRVACDKVLKCPNGDPSAAGDRR